MRAILVRLILSLILMMSLSACRPSSTAQIQDNTPHVAATRSPIAITETKQFLFAAPTVSPTWATRTPVEIEENMGPEIYPLKITVLYDNHAYDQRLKSAWGFSALVEYRDHTLLFDTGGEGALLTENMRVLGIDVSQIESVVLSHIHGDHTGGLGALLDTGVRPTVYLLPSFPASYKNQVERLTTVIDVSPGQAISEGIYSSGELGRSIPEQALVIQTASGLVVITGCAHPGIIEILEEVQRIFDEPVLLVLGGFHLGNKSEAEINSILTSFRRIGVAQAAPCHCTGERAIAMFAAEYGVDFIQVGVGKIIILGER